MTDAAGKPPDRSHAPWFVLSGAGPVLLILAVWFAAAGETGEPLHATRRFLFAAAVAALLHGGVGRRIPWTSASRTVALAVVALSPLWLAAAVRAAAFVHLTGLPGELFVASSWGLALFPAIRLLRSGRPQGRLPGALRATVGAAAALLGGAALAHGLPPVALSVLAVLPVLLHPSADAIEEQDGPAAISALAGALCGAWLLAVPPITMAFCGALPHGVAILIGALMMGLAGGRALFGSRADLSWLAAVGVGVSALLALVVAADFTAIVELTSMGDLGRLSPLLPWCVCAIVAAGTAGLAVSTAEAIPWRPIGFGAGLLVGAGAVSAATASGLADLPLRATVGLGCLAAMLAIGVPGLAQVRRRTAGWIASSCLAVAIGVVPSLPLQPAALGLSARVPADDLSAIRELDEAEVIQTGVDRCGPSAIVRTAAGDYLYRAWDVREPGGASMAAETLLGLLPVLASGAPSTAAVIGVDRGAALAPLREVDVSELVLLDLSPSWVGQVRHADEDVADMLADPAVRIERRFPLPSLPLRRGSLDVVVVSLPPPSMPGANAWYGARLMGEVSRALEADGWAAIGVPSSSLEAGDLARVIATFASTFPDGTVWVDAAGHGNVILLGSPGGGLPVASTMVRGLERRSLRVTLNDGGVRSPEDLFARAFSRADASLFLERAHAARGLAWRSARSVLAGRSGIPLARLADAAQPLEQLVDLEGLSSEDLDHLLGEHSASKTIWPLYLQFVDLVARGETRKAMDLADRLREQSNDPARDLVPLARQLIEASQVAETLGRHEDAHAWLLAADALASDDIEADLALGRRAWASGNLGDAVRRFERVLQKDPDHLVALLGAAHTHVRLGELQQALPQLEHAVDAHPDSVDALYNLGRLYADLGRLDDAMAQYRRATPIAPDNAWVHFGVGEVHFLRAVQQTEAGDPAGDEVREARQALQRAMTLQTDALILSLAGQIELLTRNYAVAEELLRESVRLDGEQFESRAALGEAFFAQRNFHAAARQFSEAARLHPADERVAFRLEQLRHLAPDALENEQAQPSPP